MNAEEHILSSLQKSERRYHLFKALLYLGCTLAIFAFTAYQANRSITQVNEKNLRVERLLRCSLPAFTPQKYPSAQIILNQCLEEVK